MPTFESLLPLLAVEPAGIAVLGVSSLLMGLAVGLGLFLALSSVKRTYRPILAVIGDAHRRVRRDQATKDSNLFSVAMSVMPVLTPIVRTLPLKSMQQSVSERYAAAGWPGGLDDEEVMGLGILIGLLMALPLTLIFALLMPMIAPLGLVALLIGPGLVSSRLSGMASAREKSLTRTMPFVLDLLTLTMRAGASLTIAIQRVIGDFGDVPIGVEFKATLTDIDMGVNTKEAFEGLAARAPVKVVKDFVDDLIQSEELGRPIAETLEALSTRTRVRRVQEATDTAGKAKVMVMVPGTLVLMATMLLLFAPFIVKFYYEGVSFE